VLIDPVRVRQILSNLVSNAVKFTHKGEVRLEWSVDLEGDQSTVRFCVTDSGIGIRADRLDAIFDSFTQADVGTHSKYGGTGLGLTISKKLAVLMRGRIGASSEEGVGSNFWVEIPVEVVRREKESAVVSNDGTPRDFEDCRLLLVEDNAVNVKVALKMLSRTGCKVDLAENGLIAISKIEAEAYDLVLMDVMMPICNGLEATRVIRLNEESRGGPSVPIIALTANGLKGDREICLGAGMNDFLSKPFTVLQLRGVLNKWLRAELADRAA
jgi:CheY-like chemotaxis protein